MPASNRDIFEDPPPAGLVPYQEWVAWWRDLDLSINHLTGGQPDETLSMRWWRAYEAGSRVAGVAVRLLEVIDPTHYQKEREQQSDPPTQGR